MLRATSFWVRPSCIGAIAVGIDIDSRVVHFLMDVGVHNAGDGLHLAQQSLRNFVVRDGIASDHLEIDRRGQTEIENLVGHVRRSEEEGLLRESLGQFGSQLTRVFKSVAMPQVSGRSGCRRRNR